MYESLKAGRVIEYPESPTLSESTAGGVEQGSITFDLCQRVSIGKFLCRSQK